MRVDLSALLDNIRLSHHVTPGTPAGVTPDAAPCLAVTPVTPVTPPNDKGRHADDEVDLVPDEVDSEIAPQASAKDGVTRVTSVTPHNSAVSAVTPPSGSGVTRVTEPRFRAWRVRMTDGRTMTVMRPEGLTEAEALEAVDRWPGSRVAPMLASRVP